jgi:hypothetical protein
MARILQDMTFSSMFPDRKENIELRSDNTIHGERIRGPGKSLRPACKSPAPVHGIGYQPGQDTGESSLLEQRETHVLS